MNSTAFNGKKQAAMKIFFRSIAKTRVICILLIILIPSARDLNLNLAKKLPAWWNKKIAQPFFSSFSLPLT